MGEKYVIWHIEGGLGKNIMATALCNDIKQSYPDRKFILVCSYPELFLNFKSIDKVYHSGHRSYFYESYIKDKDTLIFKHDPYNQTGHITQKNHVIKSWCELLNIKYNNQQPILPLNYSQSEIINNDPPPKPVLLLQTTGGATSTELNPSSYNWSRDIPYELAVNIVNKFKDKYYIVHLTKPNGYSLANVERVDSKIPLTQLFKIIKDSTKRILIDSAVQHACAAFNLPSDVLWIGTSPTLFGYDLHRNIVANQPTIANQLFNSYTYDYEFQDNELECPYLNFEDIFNKEEVLNRLDSQDNFIKLHRQL
jgi:ADP-heptose:LPS heptosyltransferase